MSINPLDRPVLGSFVYVLACFALLALVPLLGGIGYGILGNAGIAVGIIVALFLICWAAVWFMAAS